MDKTEMTNRIIALIRELAPKGTKFVWGRARRAFGSCSYRCNRFTGEYYDFKITISYPLASINTWEEVRKCVLHEIAHARCPHHGHDAVWKRECIAIGGDGKRCYKPESMGGNVKQPPKTHTGYKYIGICPDCGARFPRNRRTQGAKHRGCRAYIVWKVNPQFI